MLRKLRDVMHRGVVTCKVTATADQIGLNGLWTQTNDDKHDFSRAI